MKKRNKTKQMTIPLLILSSSLVLFSCIDSKKNETQVESISVDNSKPLKAINVYVENSGSMNGYVAGVTEFEETVYSLLSKIESSECSDTLQIFYINSHLIPIRKSVKKFVEDLEPDLFRQSGGNLATSDIAELLQKILLETNDSNLSVFISDCIFSPGRGVDAKSYLGHQEIAISTSFVEARKQNPNLGVIIYQLSSNFSGTYYDKQDKKIRLEKQQRPYYIWFIGDVNHLRKITYKIDKATFRGQGVMNELAISPQYSQTEILFDILNSPVVGEFKKSHTNKYVIEKASVANQGAKKGLFVLTLGVNMNNLILPEKYLLDSCNYEIDNSNFRVEVVKSINPRYTHFIHVHQKTSKRFVEKGKLTISLKNRTPLWINQLTDEIGEDLEKNEALEKTFGLTNLIKGICTAYNHADYAKFEITIN